MRSLILQLLLVGISCW